MSYAIVNVENSSIIKKLNNDEFNIFASRLIFNFECYTQNHSIDNFIKYFNEKYFISGKTTRTKFSIGLQKNMQVNKTPLIALIELVKLDKRNNYWSDYRFINPEELYLNYTSALWDKNAYKYYVGYADFSGIPFFYKKPKLRKRYIREGTKHNSSYSFRRRKHGEHRYQLISDWRYDSLLNQPYARKRDGLLGTFNHWDAWEDDYQSEKGNWKSRTKDKYQWEHNVRNHCCGNAFVDKRNKAKIKQDYYDIFENLL